MSPTFCTYIVYIPHQSYSCPTSANLYAIVVTQCQLDCKISGELREIKKAAVLNLRVNCSPTWVEVVLNEC